eukprot:1499150-Karenia_brevis.AAC.1
MCIRDRYFPRAPVSSTTSTSPITSLPIDRAVTTASTQWLRALATVQEHFSTKVDKFDLDIDEALVASEDSPNPHAPPKEKNSTEEDTTK